MCKYMYIFSKYMLYVCVYLFIQYKNTQYTQIYHANKNYNYWYNFSNMLQLFVSWIQWIIKR